MTTFDLCSFLFESARDRPGQTFDYTHAGRRVLVVQTLEGATQILRRNANNYHKDLWSFRQVFGSTRLTEDGEYWQSLEKHSQPYLSKFDRHRLCAVTLGHAVALAERLVKAASSKRLDQLAIDVATIKVLADTLLQGRLASVAEEFADDLHVMLDYAASYAFAARGSRTNLSPESTRTLAQVRQRMLRRLTSIQTNLPAGDNLLTSLDRASRVENAQLIFHQELLLMFSAGSDTSAAALGWCCLALAENPEVQEDIRKELSTLTDKQLMEPRNLDRLTVLNAFIEESLRLYPPIPMLGRRALAADKIDSHTVEPDDLVFVSLVGVHRDPKNWINPDDFLCSRHLSKDRRLARAIPFSSGPRVCGGAKFATLELKALLAHLVRGLRFELSGLEPGPFQWRITMRRRLGHPVTAHRIE